MSVASCELTCKIEPAENHVRAVEYHCRMFEVDVQENLVLSANGTSAGTGNNSVFGDASRNILIQMALGAECTEPISYFMIRE